MFPNLTPEQVGEAIRAFRSERCPSCGDEISANVQTFCDICFDSLDDDLKLRVLDRSKYIAVYHEALTFLNDAERDRIIGEYSQTI